MFWEFLHFYLCVDVCFYVWACTYEYSVHGDQKRAMYPLEMEFQAVGSNIM